MPVCFFYTMVQKKSKMIKNSNQGRGGGGLEYFANQTQATIERENCEAQWNSIHNKNWLTSRQFLHASCEQNLWKVQNKKKS